MKGKKTGGRRPGSPNKMTGAHNDLLNAWDKASGPETALKLMRAALDEAIKGREVIKYDKDGNEVGRQFIRDFDPIGKILPYIARRMPETIEVEDIPGLTLEEALGIIKRAGL